MDMILKILLAIFGGTISILCVFLAVKLTKMSKKNDESEMMRRRESVLILKNIDAVGSLAEKTAICVKNGRVNGDMDKAFEYREKQKHDLEDYLVDVNAMKKCVTT